MPLYDYDSKTERCTKCDVQVKIKVSKNNNPYLVNLDNSYHTTKSDLDGTYYHVTNKEMLEYVEKNGNLVGYVPGMGTSTPPKSTETATQPAAKQPEGVPKEAITASGEYEVVMSLFNSIANNLIKNYPSDNPGASKGMHINNMWLRYLQIKGMTK